jgi:Flp pilus assembly protein TadG
LSTSQSLKVSTGRRGAVIPLVAIALVAILGLAALSIDGGNMYRESRNTQVAADAAADAAAMELLAGFPKNGGLDTGGTARAAALAIASAHGFSQSNVVVNTPPLTGAFTGKTGYVEVFVKTNPPRFFSRLFGNEVLAVNSRAVAAGTLIPTEASVLVLYPTKKNTLKLKGKSSSLTVAGDVIVNSNHKQAIDVHKKAQVKAENVLVSGGLGKNSKRNIDADVQTGVDPTPNPWASLPAPPKGPTLNANDFKTTVDSYNTYTLNPGAYKELKFEKNDKVTLKPGIYYVDGGGFELKGNSTLSASGVTIFNTGNRGFKISTKGEVQISPPTSGAYKGITLFQDTFKKTKVEFNKQAHADISGIIYAPNSEVKFRGSDMEIDSGDDEEWDSELDEPMEEDYGDGQPSSISAAIVAGKLSVEKGTRLSILGKDIGAFRRLLGVVE